MGWAPFKLLHGGAGYTSRFHVMIIATFKNAKESELVNYVRNARPSVRGLCELPPCSVATRVIYWLAIVTASKSPARAL